MSVVLKILLFVFIVFIGVFLGYRIYKMLNKRIRESESGWSLLANALLLFIACAALFAGIFLALAYSFLFFAEP